VEINVIRWSTEYSIARQQWQVPPPTAKSRRNTPSDRPVIDSNVAEGAWHPPVGRAPRKLSSDRVSSSRSSISSDDDVYSARIADPKSAEETSSPRTQQVLSSLGGLKEIEIVAEGGSSFQMQVSKS